MAKDGYQASTDYDEMKYKLTSDALGIAHWDMVIIDGNTANPANIVTWSQEFRQMLGFSSEEEFPNALSSWVNRLHPEDRDRVIAAIRAHMNDLTGKTPYDLEYRLMKKSGEYRYFHAFGATMRDGGGAPLRVAGAMQDITESKRIREQMREAEERMELMLNAAPFAISMWDQNHTCLDCSTDAIKLFGCSGKQEFIDKFRSLMPEYQPDGRLSEDVSAEAFGKAFETGYHRYEWWHRTLGGELIPLDVPLVRTKYKDGYAILAYARDIREQKAMTAKIERQNSLLDTLNIMAAKLLSISIEGGGSFEASLLEILGLLGNCLDADCVQIWQNKTHDGVLHYELKYKWLSPIGYEASNIPTGAAFPYTDSWIDLFERGGTISGPVSKLSLEDQEIMRSLGIKSTVTIPLYDKEAFWGLFCLDDCHWERSFSEEDVSILRSAGLMMTSGIHRAEMMRAIESREKLMDMANRVAGLLLESEPADFDNTLRHCMGMMAKAVNADRASVWINNEKDGRLYNTQIYEWLGDAESQINKDFTREASYDDMLPGWEETLSSGRCVNTLVRDMPPVTQALMEMQGIKSLCVTPIFVRGDFWGFMGFDDCRKGRVLDEVEQDILRSCSLMVANFLLRHEMIRSLQAATEAKSNFLANMSHEMRTPLNAIIGMTSIGKGTDDAERKEYALRSIEEASANLLGIINNILDMAKIEADKLELAPIEFNIERMLKKVVSVAKFHMDGKHQTFRVHMDPKVPHFITGDDQRLSQVITNLLANASKFTPENGEISLRVSTESETDNICTLRFEVEDNGIGISPEQQGKLFSAFTQAESGISRTFGGTGLGLALCRRIVDLMDGDIRVESELGKGARFIFTVKAARSGQDLLSLLSPGIKREDLRVMVVDDDRMILEYFVHVLEGIGIACRVAASGPEALRMIGEYGECDLYFIDLRMDGMDGIELTRHIKERERGEGSVVTMISGYLPPMSNAKLRAAGIERYLLKPVFASAIIECINDCLSPEGVRQEKSFMELTRGEFEGKTLLLVEDVEINREIVIALLGDTGLVIDQAENGLEALTMVGNDPGRYDLIFMDMQMPQMDGLEATRQIRAMPQKHAATLPIIAMTANVFKEDVEKCRDAGMDGHLGKPLDMDDVLSVMRKYLR